VPWARVRGGAVAWWFVELRQLRYFLAVAEEGRFSRAARRLHIAAPSLSQQIQALERELRVPLFERTPQRVELTIAGQALVGRARVILAEVERARAEVRAAGTGRERLTLRVANMADLVLDGPLRGLGQGIDGIEVSVSSSRGDDALEAVRQARADAAVVWSRRPIDRDLDGVVLGSVLFGVVLPLGHRTADSARVPVAALAGEVLVMFPRGPFAGIWDRTVDHFFPDGAGAGQVVVEPNLLNSPEAVLRAVAAGVGVAAGIVGVPRQRGVRRHRDPASRARPAARTGGRLAGAPRAVRPQAHRLPGAIGARPRYRHRGSRAPRWRHRHVAQGVRTTFSQRSFLCLKMS
jgi:DNA-binding transcriptional LysR family regulator